MALRSGSITLLGRSPAGARGDVAYVPQASTLEANFPVSVRPAGDESSAGIGGHEVASHDEVVVSRGFQRGPGLFGAYAFTGAAFGLLLSVAIHALRFRPVSSFRRTAIAGGVLAGALTVAPWLKYPPNPPAVGDPSTLGQRQFLYLGLIVVTALVGVGASRLSGLPRVSGWSEHRRVTAVVGAVLAPMFLVMAVLPAAPDPVEVPATLVWQFRPASLGGGLLLWSLFILGLGWIVFESDHRRRHSDGVRSPSVVQV